MDNQNPTVAIVVTARVGETMETTLKSLSQQTFKNYTITTSIDIDEKGPNWNRNNGNTKNTDSSATYILFSDDDIEWYPDALQNLVDTLESNPHKSFAYGAYRMGDRVFCDKKFNINKLKKGNYISTMSLIRKADFPGFDENIKRLADWDLWLTMAELGKTGIYCGKEIFSTKIRTGITHFNKSISIEDALKIVRAKHGLKPPQKTISDRLISSANKWFPKLYRKIKNFKNYIENSNEQ
jgi:hypothetical protein